jgi:serine phosphatase RsbU (regulator of sigma subunit)
VLVVCGDPYDVHFLKTLIGFGTASLTLHHASGLEQAVTWLATSDIACVLFDLTLPDAPGTTGLRTLLDRAPHTTVLALTDTAEDHLGREAIAAGAKDLLVTQQLDGPMLQRAIERARAEESARRLDDEELRRQDNVRLQQNLLPTPLLQGSGIEFFSRYRPGRRRAVLGGDFYDAVRTPDGTVHIVIGDVCGHGAEEAALGVALRIAWRTLLLTGHTGEALLFALQQVLEHERRNEEVFATVCMLAIAPDGDGAELYLAGHPAPILLPGGAAPRLLSENAGPALGILSADLCSDVWSPQQMRLGGQWGLMLYTDGLMEGRTGAGPHRMGQDGLLGMVGIHQACGLTHDRLLDTTLTEVEELNEGPLSDDVTVLLLERGAARIAEVDRFRACHMNDSVSHSVVTERVAVRGGCGGEEG